jgi:hypothetical protein
MDPGLAPSARPGMTALAEIPKFAPLCRERWRTSESIH